MYKSVKTVGTRPGTMYGLCKVHEQRVDGCHTFQPILYTLKTPTYDIAKILVSILNPVTKSKDTVNDSFQFVEEICEEQPTLSMGSLDIDSFFTIIPLIKLLIFVSISSLKAPILWKVLQN